MKRLCSLFAIVGIVFVSNCTRIPENNDPVIGIWSKVDVTNIDETAKQTVRQEWIFNDAYLGRYHRYESKNLVFKTDFKWIQEEGVYTISYPGTNLSEHIVTMKESSEGILLEDITGNIIAKRE